MTKKTNSLLLRYGISTFWKNKSESTKVTSNIIQLENIFYKELSNKNLNILDINYKTNQVNILVYNFSQFNNLLKWQIIKYYREVLDLRKVIKKFGIHTSYLIWILQSAGITKIQIPGSTRKLKSNILLKQLILNKWLIVKLFSVLKLLRLKSFNSSILLISTSLIFKTLNPALFFFNSNSVNKNKGQYNVNNLRWLQHVSKGSQNPLDSLKKIWWGWEKLKTKHNIANPDWLKNGNLNFSNQASQSLKNLKTIRWASRDIFDSAKRLRKVNSLINFKLLAIKIENTIFHYCQRHININISHIFANNGIEALHGSYKDFKKSNFRFIFYSLLAASNYCNSRIIGDFISGEIKKNKNHFKTLSFFTNTLENLFFSNHIKFKGFQLRLSGKLNGKMRKSKYHYKLGKVQLQTLKYGLSYSICNSYTKFGIISVKTWLLHAN